MRNGAALCFAAGISWVVSASVAPPYREAEDLPERIADIAEASVWVTYHFGVFVTGAILMVALVWVTVPSPDRSGGHSRWRVTPRRCWAWACPS